MLKMLAEEPLVKTHYVSIADVDTFVELVEIKGSARALLAATIGDARLIDNLLLS
jgi:pantothenate synthetase